MGPTQLDPFARHLTRLVQCAPTRPAELIPVFAAVPLSRSITVVVGLLGLLYVGTLYLQPLCAQHVAHCTCTTTLLEHKVLCL